MKQVFVRASPDSGQVEGRSVRVEGHLVQVEGHMVQVEGYSVRVEGHSVQAEGHLVHRRTRDEDWSSMTTSLPLVGILGHTVPGREEAEQNRELETEDSSLPNRCLLLFDPRRTAEC